MDNVLICGVNWLGDSIMSMPALQAFRAAHPNAHITLLVRKSLSDLWQMHEAVDKVIIYEKGLLKTFPLARKLRAARFSTAYVLPNSFRSALIPFLAGIKERIGLPGHWRRFFLTQVVNLDSEMRNNHQAYEYLSILAPNSMSSALFAPKLKLPQEELLASYPALLKKSGPMIALIPGAARGESKRWPKEYFVELGRMLVGDLGARVLVLGTKPESPLCDAVATAIGPDVISLAGRTSLAQLAALLKNSDVVVCNDSGGMHLAAAVGTCSVVAIFGLTDPTKTGPLGEKTFILQASSFGKRDIKRNSSLAAECLCRITPAMVFATVTKALERS